MSEAAHERFNAQVNEHFEGTRDYIVTHYKTNSRTDTEYWRANAANLNLSEPLKQLLSLWMSGRGIAPPVRQQVARQGLSGVFLVLDHGRHGHFPGSGRLARAQGQGRPIPDGEIDNLLERSALNYRDHREVLDEHSAAPQQRQPAGLLLVTPSPSRIPFASAPALDAAAIRRDVLPTSGRRSCAAWSATGPPSAGARIRRRRWCAISSASTAANRSMR